jgi:2-oxoacid:acceptor oxidoreductase delta subunit (pyruvate/2-ketoisovalerate family)
METERGFVVVDRALETAAKGVFAGGDAVDQPRTVVHAIASGKRAAIAIDLQIKREGPGSLDGIAVGKRGALSMKVYQALPELPPERKMKEVVSYEMLNLYDFRKSSRLLLPELDPGEAIESFREVEGAFTRTKAVRSARRCFNCGICSFCSNCYQFCPDLAIRIDGRERLREIDYDHCKGCGICAEECPRAAIGMVQE